jgi:diketogulonate reductase-like aldo/keto reductase
VIPIVGARNEVQLAENLAAAQVDLLQEDLLVLDEASVPARPWLYGFIEKESRDNERCRNEE